MHALMAAALSARAGYPFVQLKRSQRSSSMTEFFTHWIYKLELELMVRGRQPNRSFRGVTVRSESVSFLFSVSKHAENVTLSADSGYWFYMCQT